MKPTFLADRQTHRHPYGKRIAPSLAAPTPNWTRRLPDGWQAIVDSPLYFEQYSEYEIIAGRTVGYDADDRPCFTSHYFQLTSLASDDDEELYELVTYSEELAAWRLRDERWLIFRTISTNSCNSPSAFYALSPDMPR